MYSKLRLFEMKNTKFNTKYHFLHRINFIKVLQVENFMYLVNFRFLTVHFYI